MHKKKIIKTSAANNTHKKKIIKASAASNSAYMKARKVLAAGKELLAALEDAGETFIKENDLSTVYDELFEILPGLDWDIKERDLRY